MGSSGYRTAGGAELGLQPDSCRLGLLPRGGLCSSPGDVQIVASLDLLGTLPSQSQEVTGTVLDSIRAVVGQKAGSYLKGGKGKGKTVFLP